MGVFFVDLFFIINFVTSLRISMTELLKQIAEYSFTWVRGSSVTRSLGFEVAWSIYRLLGRLTEGVEKLYPFQNNFF